MHATNSNPMPYIVYILKCRDNTLYTGITNNLTQRLTVHNSEEGGAKYTRGRRPVVLVYQESCPDKGSALSREYAIKKLTRKEKELLIHSASRHK